MCLPFAVDRLAKMNRDLRVTNDRLASTQEALMQAEKLASMGQLAAGVAHEVNNPLSTVVMLAHVLMDETAEGDPDREDLSLIASEADRCKTIVANLLQFARKNKVNAVEADLRDLTARVVRTFQRPPGVEIKVEQERIDATAEVDSDQVIQVLANLLDNAAAAMPQGGTIAISLGGDAEQVRLSVADTGTGIPKGLRSKVFEPFMTTKKSGEGTGLGLAVIYGIVKMHRGSIRLETNDDPSAGPTGTTFTIELPRRRRVEGETDMEAPCPALASGEELIG
jgi:signal transduction histidine kinase